MVRKITAALAIAALSAGFAFAQDDTAAQKPEKKASKFEISAGVGGFFKAYMSQMKYGGLKSKNPTQIGGGADIYFDLTYAEIALDFLAQSGKVQEGSDDKFASNYFGFSVLGKYPFALGEKVKIFPLLGIDYQIFLSGKYKMDGMSVKYKRGDMDSDKLKSYDNFSIQLGAGADFGLTEKIYLRPEFLYGFKLNNPKMPDGAKFLGHGPTIKVALGYKF